ncbi:thioesterase family protein [Pseudomonas boanensis]|uniref:Acyl-CoA thioesterase n=1 Tax=Metapseudomonas boanensis TaxID=2822138 RepID=A0ABS5XE11_9GAMM|nr:thioesterase family protein [Pseudomonas boanensis]MBT8765931.1 acyl-CoA thioesterase [Pseudomonas boanensis]
MASLSRTDFTYFHNLRVRWAEVDPQGIVFNGHYLTYVDVATTEYFRTLDVAYPADLQRDGGDFFAVKALLEYHAPARYDDLLDIGVRVSRLGGASLNFQIGIWRDDLQLTSGEMVYVHADTHNRTSRRLPDWLRERVLRFEGHAPQF